MARVPLTEVTARLTRRLKKRFQIIQIHSQIQRFIFSDSEDPQLCDEPRMNR